MCVTHRFTNAYQRCKSSVREHKRTVQTAVRAQQYPLCGTKRAEGLWVTYSYMLQGIPSASFVNSSVCIKFVISLHTLHITFKQVIDYPTDVTLGLLVDQITPAVYF